MENELEVVFPGEIRGQCLRRLPGDGIVRYHHLGRFIRTPFQAAPFGAAFFCIRMDFLPL